jgi:hypothetical protein
MLTEDGPVEVYRKDSNGYERAAPVEKISELRYKTHRKKPFKQEYDYLEPYVTYRSSRGNINRRGHSMVKGDKYVHHNLTRSYVFHRQPFDWYDTVNTDVLDDVEEVIPIPGSLDRPHAKSVYDTPDFKGSNHSLRRQRRCEYDNTDSIYDSEYEEEDDRHDKHEYEEQKTYKPIPVKQNSYVYESEPEVEVIEQDVEYYNQPYIKPVDSSSYRKKIAPENFSSYVLKKEQPILMETRGSSYFNKKEKGPIKEYRTDDQYEDASSSSKKKEKERVRFKPRDEEYVASSSAFSLRKDRQRYRSHDRDDSRNRSRERDDSGHRSRERDDSRSRDRSQKSNLRSKYVEIQEDKDHERANSGYGVKRSAFTSVKPGADKYIYDVTSQILQDIKTIALEDMNARKKSTYK